MEDRRGFFGLRSADVQNGDAILSRIPELKRTGGLVLADWVRPFYKDRPDYEKIAARLAGADKLRIFEILRTYSHSEIALAYAYWSIGREGVGYTIPEKRAGNKR